MNISNKLQKINCILSETNGLYHKLNVELGLSDSIAGVLYALYANEGAYPIMQLRVELSMPKQTLNSALRSLEKDGVRRPSPLALSSSKRKAPPFSSTPPFSISPSQTPSSNLPAAFPNNRNKIDTFFQHG